MGPKLSMLSRAAVWGSVRNWVVYYSLPISVVSVILKKLMLFGRSETIAALSSDDIHPNFSMLELPPASFSARFHFRFTLPPAGAATASGATETVNVSTVPWFVIQIGAYDVAGPIARNVCAGPMPFPVKAPVPSVGPYFVVGPP